MDERRAADAVEKKYPRYRAISAVRLGTGYVVAVEDRYKGPIMDGFFAVSRDFREVEEFNPVECLEEFQKVQKNAVMF